MRNAFENQIQVIFSIQEMVEKHERKHLHTEWKN